MSLKKILLPIGIGVMILAMISAFFPAKSADAWYGGWGGWFNRPLLWNGLYGGGLWGGYYPGYLWGGYYPGMLWW
jgi:hypothetical protein